MKTMLVIMAAAAMLAAGPVRAQSGAEVLKAKGCLNCHAMDKKKVGPAFKDLAAKYKGDQQAPKALVAKLKSGQGHPKIAASDAELDAAVKQVLATK
ncbi:MAG TPA: c-type cytochrome [Burkholderiales bacterium]|nr:c-type cytochrome [Burkholderiales bacterium]